MMGSMQFQLGVVIVAYVCSTSCCSVP